LLGLGQLELRNFANTANMDAPSNPKEGSVGTAVTGYDSKEVEDSTRLPFIGFILSPIFPLAGWIVYFWCLPAPTESKRWRMAVRAQYLGSALLVVYLFVLACLLGQFVFDPSEAPQAAGSPGVGFGG